MSGPRIFRSAKNSCNCVCGRTSFLVTALAGVPLSSGSFFGMNKWRSDLIELSDPA
jgi:hypothetical protein